VDNNPLLQFTTYSYDVENIQKAAPILLNIFNKIGILIILEVEIKWKWAPNKKYA